ncbi:MAG: hypothetical protein IKJ07_00850 [Clostridia bacterium]|nr:hypothetical protein [Clostridia bacterium]
MEITNKVVVLLSDLCGTENICPDHMLQADLGFDSLQMVTLLVVLEDTFDIVLDESDMNPFSLIIVRDVIELVEKYLEAKNE